MVNGIPIFRVELAEGLIDADNNAERIFGYCIEANKGPVNEPIYVASNAEAKRIFGVNFAPHFYQKGSGLILCRVGFPEMVEPSLTYKVKTSDSGNDTIDAIKITATSPGNVSHQVAIVKSPTSSKAYNLTVTIDGVGSKKFQNLSSLKNVVKKINSKFADYIVAELLFDEDKALALEANQSLLKSEATGDYVVVATSEVTENDTVISQGPFNATRLQQNIENGVVQTELTGGSLGKLRKTNGEVSTTAIPATGVQDATGTGTGDNDPNIDTTLQYAYKEAFEVMKDEDILGLAILSNNEVVQNALVEHINEMIDPEVYQYRFGVMGFGAYPAKNSKGVQNATTNIGLETLTASTAHIDNPFVIMIGQGVVFEEEGTKYNLLPNEAVQLYTGLRSALNYGQAIYGGNSRKVLTGVRDTLPLVTDGIIITRQDVETVNEAGLCTFKKEYKEITFLEGVTTAQDNPVLSHESVMSIVNYVLKRLVKVAKPFQGENVTEDLKASLINALSTELQNIVDTDNTLIALPDYSIPPYAVDVQATVMAGFNEAGEYIRETHYLVTVKIVPVGALRSITLSVVVI